VFAQGGDHGTPESPVERAFQMESGVSR
jgi:hypothetical protein